MANPWEQDQIVKQDEGKAPWENDALVKTEAVKNPWEKDQLVADERKPEDVGVGERLGAAFKQGIGSFSDVASGLGLAKSSVLGEKEEAAKKMTEIKKAQAEQAAGTPTLTAADIQRIAEEKGLVSAGAKVPSYIAEQILQSGPQMALPLAVGAATSPFITPLGGTIAGIATYGVQQFGNFLVRQAQEKKNPEELEVAKAALTAGATAPIGYFADKWTAGLEGLGTHKAMSEIYAELSARGVGGTAKEIGKRAGAGAIEGMIAEAPTEVLEQAAERYQAGLDLTSPDAMKEYKEAFFGAAAVGGALGGGSKALGAYGQYKQEKAKEKALGDVRSDRSALDELEEENGHTGANTGLNEQGVLIPPEETNEGATGVGGTTTGSMEGNQLPPSATGGREEAVNNQLNEIDSKIKQARAYLRDEMATTNPSEDNIAAAQEHLTQLETQRRQVLGQTVTELNAPGKQAGFNFEPATETTKRALEPTATNVPEDFSLKQEQGQALPTGNVEPIQEGPKAKMMLVGEGANPLAPLKSFFNSLKPATLIPEQVKDFKDDVRKLVEDVHEFIGDTTAKVARYREEGAPAPIPAEGPDVTAPLTGVQRDQRLNFLDNFFNSLSAVPQHMENQTATMSQRFAGMDVKDQANALAQLTNIPNLNTVRGIKELRKRFDEAKAKFEGEQIKEPVEKAAKFTGHEEQSTLVRRAIKLLKDTLPSARTPEDKAAMTYFGRWNYSMAMRSAAFDLGSKPNPFFSGPVFKGQSKSQAELFRTWAKENLPAHDYAKFEATVKDFAEMTRRADELMEQADKLKKEGGVAKKYVQMMTRSPTGKVSEGFKQDAGLAKERAPSAVTKMEAAKFYPMHPAMQQAIAENNIDAALSILEHSGNKFQSGLAKKLRSLGLQTSVMFDKQVDIATKMLGENYKEQSEQTFKFIESIDKALYEKYFTDLTDFAKVREGLNALDSKEYEGIIGQVEQLKTGYDRALNIMQSSGTYMTGMDVINLNKSMGGASNYAFIHELAHAATVYALDPVNFDSLDKNQQASVRELENLYNFAKRTGLDEYGFANVHEFIAEAFSNEQFQNILKSLPYKATKEHFATEKPALTKAERKEAQGNLELEEKKKEKPVSVWDKFTQLVAKLFGMDNVLGYTLANANTILKAPPAFTRDVAEFNARPKKTVLGGTLATGPAPMKFAEKIFGGRPTWEQMKIGIPGFLEDLDNTVRKYYLGAFTLRQLDDMVGHRIPQFRQFIHATEKMLDERNRILEDTKHITDKWMRFQQKNPELAKKMNLLMLDATLQGKDPAKGHTGNVALENAWKEIGTEGQEIYTKVRDFYRNRLNEYIKSNLENKKESLRGRGYTDAEIDAHDAISKMNLNGVPDVRGHLTRSGYSIGEIEAHEELQAVEDFFKRHNIEPYFPIRRFGRFSLQLGSGSDKEFYMFESAKERRKFKEERIEQRKKEGLTDNAAVERNSINKLASETSKMKEFEFLRQLKDIIRNEQGTTSAELKSNLEDSLEQLYFLTLPDQSVRKMFMNRKGTAGMNTDMLRAFTTSAFHMAYQHSRYKYSRELYGAIGAAEESIKGREGKEATIDGEYLGELEERLKYIMNPTDTGTIPAKLSNVSFLWFMTSPASAITNLLGVPAVGMPVVAARFGWANTAKKMAEFSKRFAGTGFKDANGDWDFPTLDRANLTDVHRKAYDKLVADGVIDITLSHDLVGMTEAPSNLYTGRSQRVMKYLSGAFHGAEKYNREIVAMSTFDLAYEKAKKAGYTDDAAFKKAVDQAKDLTYKSMFDYSTLNKPRYFQNEIAKVVLQFKQFSQQMTYLLARSVYEGVFKKHSADELHDIRQEIKADHKVNKPDLPELTEGELDKAVKEYIDGMKSEALKRLGGTLGMTAAFAGVTGLPMWSMLAMTMNALQAVFGDDDDTYDFDNWFKNWCNTTFGGFVGDSISRGVITQTMGADVASRLSLNDLWFRDSRKSTDEVSAVQNMMINLLGPTAGLAVSSAEALKQFNEGHIERAFETASPALIKNVMKGIRLESEGRATNIKGDELVGDVSGYEALVQGIGFSPERIAQRQKANIEMKTAEQNIMNKRQNLLNAFFMSVDNGDDALKERVIEKIQKFNQTNSEVAITADNLMKSVKTRFKQRAMAESMGGMGVNKKLIGKLQGMGEYGNAEE